jgi:hypothetical protein
LIDGEADQKEDHMSVNHFDTLVRHAAAPVSRRSSLLMVGGASLAAALARIPVAGARKDGKPGQRKNKKNKPRRPAPPDSGTAPTDPGPPPADRCQSQVADCEGSIALVCAASLDPQDCRQRMNPCCIPLGECDATEFFACLLYSAPPA